MARLVEQAAARNYDGVVVTIADYNVLQKPMAQVTAKKIPLITINSGTQKQIEELGAIMHVGQPEYDAGKGAGEKAKAAGSQVLPVREPLRDQPRLVRPLPRLCRSDRRGLQDLHARLRR